MSKTINVFIVATFKGFLQGPNLAAFVFHGGHSCQNTNPDDKMCVELYIERLEESCEGTFEGASSKITKRDERKASIELRRWPSSRSSIHIEGTALCHPTRKEGPLNIQTVATGYSAFSLRLIGIARPTALRQ